MKIRLLIHNGYAGGGTCRTTLVTAGALAELGHDVQVVSMYRRRKKAAFDVPPGVRLRPLVDKWAAVHEPSRRSLSLRRRLVRGLVRALDKRPSIVYTRYDGRWIGINIMGDIQLIRYIRSQRDGVLVGTRPGINLALALWARPGPVVVGQDHMNMTTYRETLKGQFRRCFGRLDALVTLTEGTAEAYEELLTGQTRVLSIPNAVPPLGAATAAATPEADSKLIVAAGRYTPQKGFDRLLDAWAIVAAKHPDWRLEIYGGGHAEQREKLQKRAVKLGVADSAVFMGRTSELAEIMTRAAMFVMTSRFEGFPMVLLEAMTIGLPVVSYDFPTGAREVIENGHNGYLVPNGDKTEFAARVCELIEDPEKRRLYGAAATAVKDQYDSATLAKRWEALFEKLLADETRRARRAKQPWRLRLRETGWVSVRRDTRRETRAPVDRAAP